MSTHRPCEHCQSTGVVLTAEEYIDCPHCGGTGEARGHATPRELRPFELRDCVAAMKQLADTLAVIAAKLERVAEALEGPSS